jgi:uncharacterized protein (DUF697 family)
MFWSGAWGTVPVLGITADTPGLITICGTMGGLLAQAHGRRFSEIGWNAAAVAAMQYFAGALVIKWLSSLVPVVGTVVNATVSLATVEAAGWAFHFILDDGKDPNSMSKGEMKDYFRRGREKQKQEKSVQLDDLSPEDRSHYERLSKELTAASAGEMRRQEVIAEIAALLARYRRPDE